MSVTISSNDLRGISLLAGLDDDEITELVSHCEIAICPPEATIVTQGDEGQTLYFLVSGGAAVVLSVPHVGDEVIAELPAKSTFGEVSFFHAGPHTATVRCTTTSHLMRLRKAKYEELKRENNQIALKIGCNAAALLAERLQQTDAWVAEQMKSLQDRRIHESWLRFRDRVGRAPSVSGGFTVA
jgi:CRP/FNR family cyclic AMP-dependent transcriptional regulator